MELYEKLMTVFDLLVEYSILFVELIGVGVLLFVVIKALVTLFKHGKKIRLELAEGIALALEFKMGSELLRTLIVREPEELLILGSVILLRAALAFLIQWERKIEKKNEIEARENK